MTYPRRLLSRSLPRVDASFSVMFCVHVGLCAATIAIHGNQDQKSKYLPRLAEGEIGAYSLSEAGSGTDAAAMSCTAKMNEDGSHYILNGEKMWVTNGSSAGIYVLFAKDVDHPEYGKSAAMAAPRHSSSRRASPVFLSARRKIN